MEAPSGKDAFNLTSNHLSELPIIILPQPFIIQLSILFLTLLKTPSNHETR